MYLYVHCAEALEKLFQQFEHDIPVGLRVAFLGQLKTASAQGIPRPDLQNFLSVQTAPCVLAVGRRRIGKSYSLPYYLMLETSAKCYLDLSVSIDNTLPLGQRFGILESEVGNLLTLAVILGVPIIADEVQASTLPGHVKKFIEELSQDDYTNLPRLSFLLFGSHQTRVSKLASTSLFHVRGVQKCDVPLPPFDFLCLLMKNNKKADANSPEEVFLALLKYFAAWDVDVQMIAEKGDVDTVLSLVIQSNAIIKEHDTLPEMLGAKHLNYLLAVASGKNKLPVEEKEVGIDLENFGFLSSTKATSLPGIKPKGTYSVTYAPLIFFHKADHKEDASDQEIQAAVSTGLGHVFEWVVHSMLESRLVSDLGMPKAKILHGNAIGCEVDGLVIGTNRAAFISMKMSAKKQNVQDSVFKHLFALVAEDKVCALVPVVTPVLLSAQGQINVDDEKSDWVEFQKNLPKDLEAKLTQSKRIGNARQNAPKVTLERPVAIQACSLIRDWP
jgi:hypothetical protein